jgi:hypothetical protein
MPMTMEVENSNKRRRLARVSRHAMRQVHRRKKCRSKCTGY